MPHTGYVDKIEELRRYFPKPFYNLKEGQGLSILLEIQGEKMNDLMVQMKNAREQYLLATALGRYLDIHGVNRDVFRPRGYKMPDSTYRELIKIVTNSPKQIERIFERILYLYFGPTAIDDGLCDIYSYRPNEIVLQIQEQALIVASKRDLYGTTYIHRSEQAYDGESTDLWNGTLPVNLPVGSTGFNLTSVPAGMPTEGFIHFGSSTAPAEVKGYSRSGLVVTFLSKTKIAHLAGDAINGPSFPDDYPSGYVYDAEIRTDLVGSYLPGATVIQIGAFKPERLPLDGTIYIGRPSNSNFEAKGFTRASLASTTLNLKGGLNFAHSSGDDIIPPNFHRSVRTTLDQSITAGASFPELTVVNGADFPLERGAIKLNLSFGNEEIVPFTARKLSDNTKLIIDPGYTFRFDHVVGEKVQLMARKTAPSNDGLNWPFYLNDTDALRAQFFNLMRRLKATGVKIVFEII